MLIPKILSLIILLLLFIQDAKSREVHWLLFPLLVIVFMWMRIVSDEFSITYFGEVLENNIFLALQGILLSCYFSLKNRRWTNITNGLLGPGDVLFLVSVTFCFPLLSYIVFYVVSLCVVMLIWLLWQALQGEKDRKIPLAGLQALLLAFFLMAAWWICPLNLTNDDWIVRIIY
ncbi:MAG: hypothetical protein V4577_30065 [Bacteroidota bacterium]